MSANDKFDVTVANLKALKLSTIREGLDDHLRRVPPVGVRELTEAMRYH